MGDLNDNHKSSDTDDTFQKIVDEVTSDKKSDSEDSSDVADHKLKAREGLVEYKDALEKRIEQRRGEQESKVKEKLELQEREQALDREISSLESEIGSLRAEVANTDRTLTTFDSKFEPVVMPVSSPSPVPASIETPSTAVYDVTARDEQTPPTESTSKSTQEPAAVSNDESPSIVVTVPQTAESNGSDSQQPTPPPLELPKDVQDLLDKHGLPTVPQPPQPVAGTSNGHVESRPIL